MTETRKLIRNISYAGVDDLPELLRAADTLGFEVDLRSRWEPDSDDPKVKSLNYRIKMYEEEEVE